ncbi:MAG TPA: hypothetical protein VG992_01555 [Candidatus Saccharimonadales bacterium]|nr:hypothetical protein [Candidatus Saccharimonadales bacterium]
MSAEIANGQTEPANLLESDNVATVTENAITAMRERYCIPDEDSFVVTAARYAVEAALHELDKQVKLTGAAEAMK